MYVHGFTAGGTGVPLHRAGYRSLQKKKKKEEANTPISHCVLPCITYFRLTLYVNPTDVYMNDSV